MDNFTAKDICAIIKACSQNSVKSLKLGSLDIAFERGVPSFEYDMPVVDTKVEVGEPRMDLTEEQRREIEYAERQELLAMNPVAYEQAVVDDSDILYEAQ